MKYLVTGTRNPQIPLPPELAAKLFEAAKAWFEKGFAEGVHDCHYVFPETNAGFSISNADSHEEMQERLLDYPLYPFFDWEIRPLCEWGSSYDKSIVFFKKMAELMG